MKKTSITLATLVLALASLGVAQAATPAKAHRPHARVSAEMRLHERVVEARAAQQRQWIHAEWRHHRLDAAQAASLRDAVAQVERDQRALRRAGRESLADALATSHRQDILDWAIRSGRVDFEPQKIAALDATA